MVHGYCVCVCVCVPVCVCVCVCVVQCCAILHGGRECEYMHVSGA